MKKTCILFALCNIVFLSCSDNGPPLPTQLASQINLFQLYMRASTEDEEDYEDTYTGEISEYITSTIPEGSNRLEEIHEGIILINIPEELDEFTEVRSRPRFSHPLDGFVPPRGFINTVPGYGDLLTLEEHPDPDISLSFTLTVTEPGRLPRDYEVRLIRKPSIIKIEEDNPEEDNHEEDNHEYTPIFGQNDFNHLSLLGKYILMNSITLTEQQDPIGITAPFKGTLEGNGKVLRNLTPDTSSIRSSSSHNGLFAKIAPDGAVRNLTLVDFIVEANGNYVGTIAGKNEGLIDKVQVISDHIGARISGGDYVGGLVGWNTGLIKNSTVYSSVEGASEVGGLVGRNQTDASFPSDSGKIINSHYEGEKVSGTGSEIGGLVGVNEHGSIENSHADTRVSIPGDIDNVGGLVGVNEHGSIENSYARGTVKGRENIGGLVGNQVAGEIINSYSQAAATGNRNVGGLIGNQSGSTTITHSYASGATAMYPHPTRYGNEGGLIGAMDLDTHPVITLTYYDGSGYSPSHGGVGNFFHDIFLSDLSIEGLEAFYTIHGYARIESDGDADHITEQNFPDWNFDTIWHWKQDGRWPILGWQEESR